jgi:hypothetical protein
MDFRFVGDIEWKTICDQLNGAGVPSMQDEWKKLFAAAEEAVVEEKPAKKKRAVRKAAVKKKPVAKKAAVKSKAKKTPAKAKTTKAAVKKETPKAKKVVTKKVACFQGQASQEDRRQNKASGCKESHQACSDQKEGSCKNLQLSQSL